MGRFIGRLILVPIAFVLAVVAAAVMLFSVGLERFTHAVHGQDAEIRVVFEAMKGFVALASAATIVPAILLVIVGEVARIRSALYYILGGGAALAILPLMARAGSLGDGLAAIGLIWQVFATAGFAGGAVYWLIAGRSA